MTDQIIIDSIKKLIDLNLSDEEIISNLLDAGVDFDYAKSMLEQVREKPVKSKNVKHDEKNLWDDGIITLVDQKLNEISEKQNKIEGIIQNNIKLGIDEEMKKLRVILDSQRTILISKINANLEQKSNEISKHIEEELRIIQEINKDTHDKLQNIEKQREHVEEVTKTLNTSIKDIENIKNSYEDIIKSAKDEMRKDVEEFTLSYKKSYEDIENRLNSSLNISGKIIESLVNSTKNRLESYYDKKAEEFIESMKKKTIESEVKKYIDDIISDNQKIKDMILEFNKKVMSLNQKNDVQKDIDALNSRLEVLENDESLQTFKEQYASLIKKIEKDIKSLKVKK